MTFIAGSASGASSRATGSALTVPKLLRRGLVPRDQVHRAHGSRALLRLIRENALQPHLGAIREFTARRQRLQRIDLQGLRRVSRSQHGIGLLVTTTAAPRLARPRVHPERLVSQHSSVAVQHLKLQQAIGGNLDVKRSVRGQRERPEDPRVRPGVILPAIALAGALIGLGFMATSLPRDRTRACRELSAELQKSRAVYERIRVLGDSATDLGRRRAAMGRASKSAAPGSL